MNISRWSRQFALGILLPLTLSAQASADYPLPESAAPKEVSQALRERVTQFFEYHRGAINRKAIDMVAEDTKDYYFSSGKVLFTNVQIMNLDFSKDFQKAAVRLETTQMWQVGTQSTLATTPVVVTWKMEDGKWVWYLDNQMMSRSATPMGESAPPPTADGKLLPQPLVNADGTLNIPSDFAEPARVAAQSEAILSQAGVDKTVVTFNAGESNEDKITFHNGFTGQVSLKLYEAPQIPGLKITLSKSDLGPREDAVVKFVYDGTVVPAALARPYTIRLGLAPFAQEYPIKFTMEAAR
ncbi:MAG: hypothetical protein ABIR70_13565 [Bryobacteraceae bacterium]